MPQTRSNKGQTPVNADTFNLTGDLATFCDSLEVIVPVANDAEGDTIATTRGAAGFPVSDSRPLFVYNTTTKTPRVKDSTGWRDLTDGTANPLAHMGRTAGFQALTGQQKIPFSAAQLLAGGFTFNDTDDALVVPKTGRYNVRLKSFFTGGASNTNQAGLVLNTVVATGAYTAINTNHYKGSVEDISQVSSANLAFVTGDKVGVWHSASGSGLQTWGTDGYNGVWLEMEWAGV